MGHHYLVRDWSTEDVVEGWVQAFDQCQSGLRAGWTIVVAEAVAVLRKWDAALGEPGLGAAVGLTVGSLAKPRIGLNLDGEPFSYSLGRLAGSTQVRGVDLNWLTSDPARQDLSDTFGLLVSAGCQL